jgi:hypothetical protein
MENQQYVANKEEDPNLHEKQPMESVSDTSSQHNANHRLFRNYNLGKHTWHPHTQHSSSIPNEFTPKDGESSLENVGSRHEKDKSQLMMGGSTKVILLFCFLVSVANIAIMSNMNMGREHQFELKGGDHVQACPDHPEDQTCFEVRDSGKRLIYKMRGGKRIIGFSQCSSDTPETPSLKCVGELAFSHKASSVWNYRLYRDVDTKKYSIVAGPHGVDLTDDVFRVRHMLQAPYNWIISKEAIPQDDYPRYGLYIKGDFLFDDSE